MYDLIQTLLSAVSAKGRGKPNNTVARNGSYRIYEIRNSNSDTQLAIVWSLWTQIKILSNNKATLEIKHKCPNIILVTEQCWQRKQKIHKSNGAMVTELSPLLYKKKLFADTIDVTRFDPHSVTWLRVCFEKDALLK